MKNIALVTSTNSNYSFVWDMHLKQIDLHFPQIKSYVLSDKGSDKYPNHEFLIYDENDPYYTWWSKALNQIPEEYFIYLQEDFTLYKDVNVDKIEEFKNFLINNPQWSFIRLMKSGQFQESAVTNDLFEINNKPNYFAMQATIWRKKDYIDLYETVKEKKWLEIPLYNDIMEQKNIRGLYYYGGERQRGSNHWDSNVFPCIATSIVKAKWNLREYPIELGKLMTTYNLWGTLNA